MAVRSDDVAAVALCRVCTWLADSAVATSIRESDNLFSVIETVHVVGIVAVVGVIVVVDLRVLRVVLADVPLAQLVASLTRIVWCGFALMSLSGALLLAAEADRLYGSTAFRAKALLLLCAGANALWYRHAASRRARSLGVEASPAMRVAAVGSLLVWLGVIVCGRAVAYL